MPASGQSRGRPADRYGERGRRPPKALVAGVVVLATAFAGWVVWAALAATAEDAVLAVESGADTIELIISEVAASRITERGATRADDKFSEAAMEDRKREGYF